MERERIVIRVSKDVKENIKEIAKNEDTSISSLGETLFKRYIREYNKEKKKEPFC